MPSKQLPSSTLFERVTPTNGALSSFQMAKIVVVESLEDGEVKTGLAISERLSALKSSEWPRLEIELQPIQSARELEQILERLTVRATQEHQAPLLHAECHGDPEDGLEFANGSTMSWQDLVEHLAKLNIACGFNLVVLLSACFGGYLLGRTSVTQPAPFFCAVAPTQRINPAESMQGFRTLYDHLFKTRDLGLAAAALRATGLSEGSWFAQPAETWFEKVLGSYIESQCSHSQMQERARRLYRRAKQDGLRSNIGSLRRQLREENRTVFAGKFFDHFFCVEEIPSNAARFRQARNRVRALVSEYRATGRYQL